VLYQRVTQDIQQLRGCLAAGYPIVFGFSVYTSFESDAVAKSGRVPNAQAEREDGVGHALLDTNLSDDFCTTKLVQ
jgi:hypothetical protein